MGKWTKAIDEVVIAITLELAHKNDVVPRVEIASFERAKPFVEMRVRHFCIGWDTRVMSQ